MHQICTLDGRANGPGQYCGVCGALVETHLAHGGGPRAVDQRPRCVERALGVAQLQLSSTIAERLQSIL